MNESANANDNMTTLDDTRFDQQWISMLERKALRNTENGMKRELAELNALKTHPVMQYVLNLPVEDASYPAFYMDHRFTEGGSAAQERRPPKREYIQWCMPAHDQERPHQKGCGFIKASDGSIVYTACSEDHHHHIKAKKNHCWSLRCPVCCNDTALKKAIKVERQLLIYEGLVRKEGGNPGRIGHWVISPPQEFMKDAMQTFPTYDNVVRYIESELAACGATAGYTVFHPWRQVKNRWKLSPHFHTLLYGHIDTKRFLSENKGWIIKKIHPKERIRSIRHTVAYLMTHMGLGMVVKEPEDVDWDLAVLQHFDPDFTQSGKYSEDDYNDMSEGRGRMVGDCSDIDWTEFTQDRLVRDVRVRYWGGASYKNIVKIDNYRQYKIRTCRECNSILRTYDGFTDSVGTEVRYIQDNGIYSFARNRLRAKEFFLRYKDSFRKGELDKADVARIIPVTICTLELDVPRNNDLIMDGPFDEPDSKFEKRQLRAYGDISL